MHGCIDPAACNYNPGAVIDDESCLYENECSNCSEAVDQTQCMLLDGCMWMGDHCMSGSSCTHPIAFNYNPIADVLETGDNTTCQYSSFINFGCIYPEAINFDSSANVDDGSCEYTFADLNSDGIINILDIVQLVSIIID